MLEEAAALVVSVERRRERGATYEWYQQNGDVCEGEQQEQQRKKQKGEEHKEHDEETDFQQCPDSKHPRVLALPLT